MGEYFLQLILAVVSGIITAWLVGKFKIGQQESNLDLPKTPKETTRPKLVGKVEKTKERSRSIRRGEAIFHKCKALQYVLIGGFYLMIFSWVGGLANGILGFGEDTGNIFITMFYIGFSTMPIVLLLIVIIMKIHIIRYRLRIFLRRFN